MLHPCAHSFSPQRRFFWHGVHGAENKPTDNPYLTGQLPAELLMHIDMVAGISARSTNDKQAPRFLEFILSPEQKRLWASRRSNRFRNWGLTPKNDFPGSTLV